MILVNKPFLPPEKEYKEILSSIWGSQWLTNDGPLLIKLQTEISDYLNLHEVLFTTNGTIALQLAIKALDLVGEIITTPFSFVATTSTIVWESCKPVFVDIDKDTLNIDPQKIENAITSKTKAILATHVFGNPCDVEAIDKIARKYNLKVIYDGAHAFGVKFKERSIFEYGDISICSTHATKVYHTVEGGFLVTENKLLFDKIKSMRNFGFKDATSFSYLGINAKNSEFHAAMGLVNLPYQDKIYNQRKLLSELYDELLNKAAFCKPKQFKNSNKNYAYYPVLLENESVLLYCMNQLEERNIYGRRYFYPSLANSLNYVVEQKELPIVNDISKRILCLPLYYDLSTDDVKQIASILNEAVLNHKR